MFPAFIKVNFSALRLYAYMPLYLSVPNIIDLFRSKGLIHIAGSSASPLIGTCGVSAIGNISKAFMLHS